MAFPFFSGKLTVLAFSALVALSACDETMMAATSAPQGADRQLVSRADIMSRTIVEGAALGAGFGALSSVLINGGSTDDLDVGLAFGAVAGVAAGTYVGYLQSEYAQQEQILARVQSDLDRNSAEVAATINVMRGVLAVQEADLAALRSGAAAGTVAPETLAAGVVEAEANLTQMTRAINGVTARQVELSSARQLVGSAVDADLRALSRQIAEMRAIADELATNI